MNLENKKYTLEFSDIMQQFRPSRFQVLPTIIKNLLIINILFFVAKKTIAIQFDFSMENLFALHTWKSELFKPWQLLTHMFMHGDLGHIFGNMFALWMFGAILENLWGAQRFLTFYIICGLGAALLHLVILNVEINQLSNAYSNLVSQHASGKLTAVDAMLDFAKENNIGLNPDAIVYLQSNPDNQAAAGQLLEVLTAYYENTINTPTVGASGAVFGVLAAFVYLFPNTYIYLYFFIPVKAKWLGLFYFAYEIFFALRNSAGDNVARWAHIGGGLVGLLIVITWNKSNKKTFY